MPRTRVLLAVGAAAILALALPRASFSHPQTETPLPGGVSVTRVGAMLSVPPPANRLRLDAALPVATFRTSVEQRVYVLTFEEWMRKGMKTFLTLLTAMLALPALGQAPAKPLARFAIVAETTAQEVRLTCETGCEWKTIHFPLTATPMWLDRTRLLGEDGDKVPADGPFLLAVYAHEGTADQGLDVLCQRGCAHDSLAFSPGRVPWVIDQCEVTVKMFWKAETVDVPCAERHRER